MKELQGFEKSLLQGDSAYGQPVTILDQAFRIYQSIYSSKEGWTGAFSKANESVFISAGQSKSKDPICFNCGGPHLLDKCTQAKNPGRIQANKKAFWDARKKAQKDNKKGNKKKEGKKKWPSPPSNRNHKPVKIDGTLYYYNFKAKKWLKCKDQKEAAAGLVATGSTAPVPAPLPPMTQVAAQTQSASDDTSAITKSSDVKAATAAFVKAMNNTIASYASQIE